jgi:asparagine synthase (glutamine-hydrolysing)
MCGLFGILYSNKETRPCESTLRRSAELINHRGPDGHGVFVGAGIGLAHTRLSLVDPTERSNQPLWDTNGRYCLVYNGEIYNFRELRQELSEREVQFETSSDTEVLLQLLILEGPNKTLPRLKGMFSFGFYDTLEKKLIVARDRFGIKPLLIYRDAEKFIFASEVKSIKPWVDLKPNSFQMIRHLMNYGVPVRNSGFFDDVEMVPPGSVITIDAGREPKTESFASLPDMLDANKAEFLNGLNPKQAVDHVDELLQRSVERMMFADAVVGALCSGGVDSSLLMAIAARTQNNLAIFHADVVGRESELDAASALAKHLKLDLLTTKIHDNDFLKLLPQVIYHYEFPFSGHPHSVPFLMVSNLVRDSGVKGVLTGEGADELFHGYNHLAYEPLWNFYDRQTPLGQDSCRLY